LDEGEGILTALKRECQEEIGCDIEVLGEVGSTVEYRKIFTLKQTSYCYVARVVGEKGTPHFMGDEIEEGFKEVWLSYEDAERALVESQATDYERSAYIVPRDILLLKEARRFIK
jgi:8-oxo-dGTP pyrophosphatase MutT (NUDIX family)